jgi:hypothetical protein
MLEGAATSVLNASSSSQEASAALTQIYAFFIVTRFYIVATDSLVTAIALWVIAGIIADYGQRARAVLFAATISLIEIFFGAIIRVPIAIYEWGGPGTLEAPSGPGGCIGCNYYPSLQFEFQIAYFVILVLYCAILVPTLLKALFRGRTRSVIEKIEGFLGL